MSAILPTLTRDGFVEHPQALLVKLYEYFLNSNYSQSTFFNGKITSLQYLIREYGNNGDDLCDAVKDKFYDLLNKYLNDLDGVMTNLEVNVSISKVENVRADVLVIDGSVTIDGIIYTISREVLLDGTSFLNDAKKLNYLYTGVYE